MSLPPTPFIASVKKVELSGLKNVALGHLSLKGWEYGKNDPFVVFRFCAWTAQTDPIENAGEAAVWEKLNKAQFQFNLNEKNIHEQTLQIDVYHAGLIQTTIGQAVLSLEALVEQVLRDILNVFA